MTELFRPTLIRAKAWEALTGKWMMGALVALILAVAMGINQGLGYGAQASVIFSLFSLAFTLLVIPFITIGTSFTFLDVSRGAEVEVDTVFEPAKSYWRYTGAYIMVIIYTILWMLLLIVPGIIKALAYSQTFFIMRENPEMTTEEAIQRSMAMMDGHKMDYFLLGLSFIGWILLGFLALGIGILWVYPYIYTANGVFYDRVKADYEGRPAGVVQA